MANDKDEIQNDSGRDHGEIQNDTDIFKEIPDTKYREEVPAIDPAEFVKVVESRRSVRVYSDEKVPEEVMNKCLDLALLAPNSSNLQPWEFYWVRSAEKKARLVEACFSQPAAKTAAEIVVAVARTDTWRRSQREMLKAFSESEQRIPKSAYVYYNKIVPMAYNLGPLGLFGLVKRIALFFMGLFKVVPRGPSSEHDMEVWAQKSTALACENLMLAFRAYGYDTCPMEGLDARRVKKLLGLGRRSYVVMAVGIGRRSGRGIYGPRLRFDRSHFVKEV